MAQIVYEQGPPPNTWQDQNQQEQYYGRSQGPYPPPMNQPPFTGGRSYGGNGYQDKYQPPAFRNQQNINGHINRQPQETSGFGRQPEKVQYRHQTKEGEIYRAQNQLEVQGLNVPDPVFDFQSAGFSHDILHEINKAGFSAPTPIQAQCWPIIMSQQDLVGIAKTGSGKTCAFLLPGLMHIMDKNDNPKYGPTMLVLAPTRELAMQTKSEADKFGVSAGIKNVCLYGGAPRGGQFRELQRGAHIVIATPGRINDFLENGQCRLKNVTYLVLDEADRMLDMGFEPQIRQILDHMPPNKRQTLLFSATWPREVRDIASQYMSDEIVNVFIGGGADGEVSANTSVEQKIEILENFAKKERIQAILRSKPAQYRTIIFTQTKKGADELAEDLFDFRAAAIHGDKNQQERDYTLRQFKSGRSSILVATDVAARGLDIPNVNLVVNYDFPQGVEDYVHRIGRTGRAGATGESITFLTWDESRIAKDLIKVLEKADQPVPVELRQMAQDQAYKQGGKYYKQRYNQKSSYGKYTGGGNWRENKTSNFDGDGYNSRQPYSSANANGGGWGTSWGDDDVQENKNNVSSWGDQDSFNNNRAPQRSSNGVDGGWGGDGMPDASAGGRWQRNPEPSYGGGLDDQGEKGGRGFGRGRGRGRGSFGGERSSFGGDRGSYGGGKSFGGQQNWGARDEAPQGLNRAQDIQRGGGRTGGFRTFRPN